MKKPARSKERSRQALVSGVLRSIDLLTAILLLTGQITATGVFLSPGAFWLSVTGPILGGRRIQGVDDSASGLVDAIDIITAFLLILGQVQVTGPWISSGGFSLPITGPAFGNDAVPSPIEAKDVASEFYSGLKEVVIQKFAPGYQSST